MATTKLTMKFLGAAGTVTGSCTLLTFTNVNGDTSKFLVDAGSYQGERSNRQTRNEELKQLAPSIKGIFITHAHIDHTGLLPTLVGAGFKGKVYCTKATHDILIPMLYDAMWVEGTRKNHEEIWAILKQLNFYQFDEFEDFVWGQKFFSVVANFQVGILRAGHVLGAVSYYFRWIVDDSLPEDDLDRWKVIHFSGDVGSGTDESESSIMLKPPILPYYGKQNAYIVLESTYGTRPRPSKNTSIIEERIDKLYTIIQETFKKGGSVLIPAFAFNRSQEILLDIEYIQYLLDHGITYYDQLDDLLYVKDSEREKKGLKLKRMMEIFPEIDWSQYTESFLKQVKFNSLPSKQQEELISKLDEMCFWEKNTGFSSSEEEKKLNLLQCDKNEIHDMKLTDLKEALPKVTEEQLEQLSNKTLGELKDSFPEIDWKQYVQWIWFGSFQHELQEEIISKLEEMLDEKKHLKSPVLEKILELKFDKNQAQSIKAIELENKFSSVPDTFWKSTLKDIDSDNTFKGLSQKQKNSIIGKLKDTYALKSIPIKIAIASPLISRLNEEGFRKHLYDSFMTKDGIIRTKYLALSIFSRFNLDAPTEADDPQTFRKKIGDLNKKLKSALKSETPSQNQGKNKKQHQKNAQPITKQNGHVIITSSGMCDEGKVMELLPQFLKNSNDTIILTGYQAEKTNGRLLKELASGKFDDNFQAKYNHHLKGLDIRLSDICCRIEDLSSYYSSHADQTQLVNYVHGISGDPKRENIYPTKVFLNHGTDEGRQALAEAIKQRNEETNHKIEVVLPAYGEEFEL